MVNILLPTESRGYVYDRIFSVEMNDFDIGRLLPSLFYLVVTRGRQRGGKPNDPTAFSDFIDKLSTHKRMCGFNNDSGRRLLDKWVRSSIIHVGKMGRSQDK